MLPWGEPAASWACPSPLRNSVLFDPNARARTIRGEGVSYKRISTIQIQMIAAQDFFFFGYWSFLDLDAESWGSNQQLLESKSPEPEYMQHPGCEKEEQTLKPQALFNSRLAQHNTSKAIHQHTSTKALHNTLESLKKWSFQDHHTLENNSEEQGVHQCTAQAPRKRKR